MTYICIYVQTSDITQLEIREKKILFDTGENFENYKLYRVM